MAQPHNLPTGHGKREPSMHQRQQLRRRPTSSRYKFGYWRISEIGPDVRSFEPLAVRPSLSGPETSTQYGRHPAISAMPRQQKSISTYIFVLISVSRFGI
jgi:hypothetical protein